MDRGKALFILAVVIAAAIAASQGGLSNLDTQGSSGTTKRSSWSFLNFSSARDNPNKSVEDKLDDAEKEALAIQKAIDEAKAESERSPLSEVVSLSISSAGATKPELEYLTISVSSRQKGKILLSGMTLKSTITGRSVSIGKGVELPFAGVVNDEAPIFLSPGDKAVIITGKSPTGYSFRLNKCAGYFSQFQSFTPSLPRECPAPRDEAEDMIGTLTDKCYDYLGSVSRCVMPLQNTPAAYLDSACYTFVSNKLNYKTCSEFHKGDTDFIKKEWRVYLGRSEELWKSRREVIKLLDLEGKTVDSVTY